MKRKILFVLILAITILAGCGNGNDDECSICNGTGYNQYKTCPACNGTGK